MDYIIRRENIENSKRPFEWFEMSLPISNAFPLNSLIFGTKLFGGFQISTLGNDSVPKKGEPNMVKFGGTF